MITRAIGIASAGHVKTTMRFFRYSAEASSHNVARMDLIYLRDLKIDCVIGAFEWERRIRQTVTIDLEMAADVARAARTDRLEDTLDYKAIAKRLQEYVGASEFTLVETLAERIAAILLEEFKVGWVRVRLNKKGALRHASDVGVVIERGRTP
jgi:7,8-dihydroneopterin aldolase/epimerase/oxygenase